MLSFATLSFAMLSFFAALGLNHCCLLLIAERVNCTLLLRTIGHARVETTLHLGGTSSASSSSIVVIPASQEMNARRECIGKLTQTMRI